MVVQMIWVHGNGNINTMWDTSIVVHRIDVNDYVSVLFIPILLEK